MKNKLTLIDFTETATFALKQAIAVAKMHDCSITLCHVASSAQEVEKAVAQLAPSLALIADEGLEALIKVVSGDLFHQVPLVAKQLQPDLVVVGTHGVKGLRQNLFGSNIYKLVSHIPIASLVVSDYTNIVEGGFKKVLFPVAPHLNYQIKAEQTLPLLAPSATVLLFEISKPGVELDGQIWKNLEDTKSYLTQKGIVWEFIEKGTRSFSIGYSHETLEFARLENIDLLVIMTQVSEQGKNYGLIDKENVLLNKQGLPVLCSNA